MIESGQGHTFQRMDNELQELSRLLGDMGEEVLAQVREALAAFRERRPVATGAGTARALEVDRMRLQANAGITQVLAKWCPHGGDLRMVLAIHKGIADLERTADEAARITELVDQLFGQDQTEPAEALLREGYRMAALAAAGLEGALAAFESWDEAAALEAIRTHRELHEEFQAGLRLLMTYVMEDFRNIGFAINLILVLQSLERIGLHARNLAQDVILRVRGEEALALDAKPAANGP
jgi:phosphate transport system protein